MTSRMTACIRMLGLGLLLLTNSCAYPVSTQLRQEAKKDNVTFPAALENPAAYAGATVVWGGKIIETVNHQDSTDIIVLDTPLDFLQVPQATERTRGRFIARSTEFLDPALYEADREITLAGEIVGAEERPLGQTTYRYPIVQVKELHLWEKYYDQYAPDYFWYPPVYSSFYYVPSHYHYRDRETDEKPKGQ